MRNFKAKSLCLTLAVAMVLTAVPFRAFALDEGEDSLALANAEGFSQESLDQAQEENAQEEIVQEEIAEEANQEEIAEEAIQEESISIDQAVDQEIFDILPSSDELLLGYFERELFGEERASCAGIPAAFSSSALDSLNSYEQQVYNKLKAEIKEIAKGTNDTTFTDRNTNNISCEIEGATFALSGKESDNVAKEKINTTKIIYALLCDLPYDFFWFDKTASTNASLSFSTNTDGKTVTVKNATFDLPVAKDYRHNNNTYLVDLEKTGTATTAVKNAQKLVNENAGKNDDQKLEAYRDYICDNVEYDKKVDINTPYGDPWQVIYVFDGNPTTNVVCEGYAKAFQYLCDISSFNDKSLVCNSVVGYVERTAEKEKHMWNIVRKDNKNYLVDVTWCDDNDESIRQTKTKQYYMRCVGDTKSPTMTFGEKKGVSHEKDTGTYSSYVTTFSTDHTRTYAYETVSALKPIYICLGGDYEHSSKVVVTFKIENGTWKDSDANDIVVDLENGKLTSIPTPTTDKAGFKGAWLCDGKYVDVPTDQTEFTQSKTYIYHFGEVITHKEVKPTCTTGGNDLYYTIDGVSGVYFSDAECKNKIVDPVIPATGHTWGEWKDSTSKLGYQERECSVCHTVEYQKNHTCKAGEVWKKDSSSHWQECVTCKEKMNVSSHTFGEWTTTKSPTTAEPGSKKRTCSVCGYDETTVIPKLPPQESSKNHGSHHRGGGGGGSRGGGGGATPGSSLAQTGMGGGVAGGSITNKTPEITQISIGGVLTEKTIRTQDTSISPYEIKSAIKLNNIAPGKSVHIDTYEGANVRGRFYIDEALANKLTKPIKTKIIVNQNYIDNAKANKLFDKWFDNKIMSVTFEQKGEFGARMPVAVKVNFEGFEGDDVYIYRYRASTNSYRFLQVSKAVKDDLSYFYFNTPYGDTLVMTDGPLKDKQA